MLGGVFEVRVAGRWQGGDAGWGGCAAPVGLAGWWAKVALSAVGVGGAVDLGVGAAVGAEVVDDVGVLPHDEGGERERAEGDDEGSAGEDDGGHG